MALLIPWLHASHIPPHKPWRVTGYAANQIRATYLAHVRRHTFRAILFGSRVSGHARHARHFTSHFLPPRNPRKEKYGADHRKWRFNIPEGKPPTLPRFSSLSDKCKSCLRKHAIPWAGTLHIRKCKYTAITDQLARCLPLSKFPTPPCPKRNDTKIKIIASSLYEKPLLALSAALHKAWKPSLGTEGKHQTPNKNSGQKQQKQPQRASTKNSKKTWP